MTRLYTAFPGILLLLALPFTGPAAAPDDFEYGTRKPIETVAIEIKGIHRDLGTWDITANSLRNAIADRLGSAGIRVININELANHPDADVVTLRLTLNRAPYYFYMYGLNMAVRNKLALSHDSDNFTTIKTWSETRNGMLMPGNLGNIRRMSLQLLDDLLREHGRG